eukprot:TRINITY_DN819_c0_g1_i2.p1 TRINITY_DN819_c0_g1~~TRINITY_DN819_c0_g1_i2.p1  ORF type:complete len:984 (-),score=141.01 TRINITY_DN819_c0_g1_i2:91-3042(-)
MAPPRSSRASSPEPGNFESVVVGALEELHRQLLAGHERVVSGMQAENAKLHLWLEKSPEAPSDVSWSKIERSPECPAPPPSSRLFRRAATEGTTRLPGLGLSSDVRFGGFANGSEVGTHGDLSLDPLRPLGPQCSMTQAPHGDQPARRLVPSPTSVSAAADDRSEGCPPQPGIPCLRGTTTDFISEVSVASEGAKDMHTNGSTMLLAALPQTLKINTGLTGRCYNSHNSQHSYDSGLKGQSIGSGSVTPVSDVPRGGEMTPNTEPPCSRDGDFLRRDPRDNVKRVLSYSRKLRVTMAELEKEKESIKKRSRSEDEEKSWWGCICNFFNCVSSLEVRTLDFRKLTTEKYGGSIEWADLPVTEQVVIIREALTAKTFLIDPDTDYMKSWDVIVMVCLIFTGIVTPYEIAFIEQTESTLKSINRIVDMIFIKDLCMQFVLKVKKTTRQGSIWIKDRRMIAHLYMRTWFIIDLLSVIPYEDLSVYLVQSGVGGSVMEKLSVVRLLRVCRLCKLGRILKASKIAKRWENRIGLPSAKRYIISFSVLILAACHWMACAWGFFGMLFGTNLKCRDRLPGGDDRLTEYPDRKFFLQDSDGLDSQNPQAWVGESWVVSFAAGRAQGTPSDPCNPWTVYIVAVYWAVMTLTSIGYGDILPITLGEYAVCTICMMGSSVLWAYIIGAGCALMSNLDPEQTEFEHRMDAFNAMARDQELNQDLRARGRQYIREERFHHHFLRNRAAVHTLGHNLRGTVSRQLAAHYLDNVWFFRRTSSQFREETANKLVPHFYERREVVEQFGRLCVVERGAVGRSGRILVPWNYWGEDMLVRLDVLRNRTPSITLSYTELVTLSREDLSTVLIDYPEELDSFRRSAALLAVMCIVRVYKEGKAAKEFGPQVAWVTKIIEPACAQGEPNGVDGSILAADGAPQFGEVSPSFEERLDTITAQVKQVHQLLSSLQADEPKLAEPKKSWAHGPLKTPRSPSSKRPKMM